MTATETIRVDAEFEALIPPLQPEERQQLEESIAKEGCRDRLVVWAETGILVDGHNRYSICKKLGRPFNVAPMSFPSRDAAADWVDRNQLGRRNLTPDQMSLLRGRRYNRAKKAHGGDRKSESASSGQSVHLVKTAEALAKQHGVDEKTIRRDGQFAKAVEAVKSADPTIERRVAQGGAAAPARKDVIKAAELLERAPDKAKAILAGTAKTSDVVREIKREEIIAKLEDVKAREVKAASGVYDVLVIDPP